MGDKTAIQWTDATWNPVRGCSRVSPGCGGPNHEGGCYAEKIAARFSDPGQPYHGFAERTPHGGRWTGKLALIDSQLDLPLRWRKPRRIFVNSMSDLFHEALPDEAIDRVFAVMARCPQHTFQVLTKRAQRMRHYLSRSDTPARGRDDAGKTVADWGTVLTAWPLPNVWLGVSVEAPPELPRIWDLLHTLAAKRFVSFEPLLTDVSEHLGDIWKAGIDQGLDWAIIGGESGPNARPFDISWARRLIAQLKRGGVACFMKQFGSKPILHGFTGMPIKDRKGGDPSEWPEDLHIRQFPR